MRRLVPLISLTLLLLAGCSDGGGRELPPEGRFSALHAVADLETASFFVSGAGDRNRGNLEYTVFAAPINVAIDTYEFWFQVILPEEEDPTRIVEFEQTISAEQEYTFVLVGTALTPALVTWERPRRTFSDNSIWLAEIGHVAASQGPLDIYIEVPGTDVAGAVPRAQIDFGGFEPGIELAPGDYQLTVTERDLPGNVIFASDTFTADASRTLLFSILDDAGTGTGEVFIRVLGSNDFGVLLDLNSPPELRAVHAAFGTDPVDIAVAGDFDPPLFEDLAFPELQGYEPTLSGENDLTVTDAGNPGAPLVEGTLNLLNGDRSIALVVGPPEDLELVSFFESNRRFARYARLRFLQMAANEATDALDIYLVDQGEDYTEFVPLVRNLVFRASTGYIDIVEGDYELVVTPAGDPDTVLAGPTNLDLDATGIYGYYIVDSDQVDTVELRPLDDLAL
jgi:hypothetical protein